MEFDDLIKLGILETLDEKCAQYPQDEKKHRFSLAYKIKRSDTIRSQKETARFSVRKIKYVLLAAILATLALTGFSGTKSFGVFSLDIFEKNSRVVVNTEGYKPFIKEVYGLPDKYETIFSDIGSSVVSTAYDVRGKEVYLIQSPLTSHSTVDLEGSRIEGVSVNGYEGFCVSSRHTGDCCLILAVEGYEIKICGKTDKDTAVELAGELEIKNF